MTPLRARQAPSPPTRRCAASYGSIFAAQLAVDHLVARGLPEDMLRIDPAGVHPPEGWRERTQRRPRALRAALVGTIVAGTGVAAIVTTWSVTAISLVAGAVIAVLAVVVAVRVERWRAAAVRRRAQTTRLLEADRFEVVCTGQTDEAEHLLARWWNPQAPALRLGAEQDHDAARAAERRLDTAA